MQAMALSRYGGPEVLEAMELPEPKVGPDSMLIRTRAVGVNPVDYKLREGGLDGLIPSHFPLVPGFDVAGVVERVGPAVVGIGADASGRPRPSRTLVAHHPGHVASRAGSQPVRPHEVRSTPC